MKRIVICCDGTWNTPYQRHEGVVTPTNVARLASLVKQEGADGVHQIVYYDLGVGTGSFIDRVLGGVFGVGLYCNVQEAYCFLCLNYTPGDEIFLFGFSRGAYTVRSVAGLIRNCGILKKQYLTELKKSYDLYRNRNIKPDDVPSKEYREKYSWDNTRIKFIGVWDTVGSLGIPFDIFKIFSRQSYKFHDQHLSGCVDHAYQAVSVDELRRPFMPTLWDSQSQRTKTLEQVWFSGVHSDIGGGYPDTNQANLCLQWMQDKAHAHGLCFDPELNTSALQITQKLHWSLSLCYILFGWRRRKMHQFPKFGEEVHPSVITRLRDSAMHYQPLNLIEHRDGAEAVTLKLRIKEGIKSFTKIIRYSGISCYCVFVVVLLSIAATLLCIG